MQTETPPADEATSHRFFQWMRGLDVPRGAGWMGGVCSGVAARLGIDPLIVRGVFVVVAVLGGPALLVYAAAWLLLPDAKGAIHLEELVRGRFGGAHAGIIALVILSLLPITQGLWSLGAVYWGTPVWGESVGRALWTLALIALAVVAIVWVARRAARPARTPDAAPAPTPTPGTGVAVIEPDTTTVVAEIVETAPVAAAPAVEVPTIEAPPVEPGADAPEADFVEWRQRQDEWRQKNEEYRAYKAVTADQRRAEGLARAEASRIAQAAYAAEQAERRRLRRLANPRLSAAWVFIVLGLAILLGGIAALVASVTPEWTGTVLAAGLAAAALVVGIGIICAGAARRRSGFLSFVGIVLIACAIPAAFIPGDREILSSSSGVGSGKSAQLLGTAFVSLDPDDAGDVDLWQGSGTVQIWVSTGQSAHVVIDGRSSSVFQAHRRGVDEIQYEGLDGIERVDGTTRYSFDLGAPTPASPTIRIWQGNGNVQIEYDRLADMPVATEGDQE